MTYLFQLRTHFTGKELQVEQLGNEETESSYLVGRHDTDGSVPAELFTREVAARRSRTLLARPRPDSQESQESKHSQERSTPDKPSSPTAIKDVRDLFLQQSKTILGKMLSPARDQREKPSAKWFADPLKVNEPLPARPEKLMTRKELTDPFGSDDEEEQPQQTISNSSPPQLENNAKIESGTDHTPSAETTSISAPAGVASPPELPRPTPPMTEEERQVMLRERARKLIADARAGIVSPTSPLSPGRVRSGTVEIISKQSVMDELAAAAGGMEQLDALLGRQDSVHSSPSRNSSISPDRSEDHHSEDSRSIKSGSQGSGRRSPLHSFSALVDRLTPDKELPDEGRESGSYIQSELEALEKEQKSIDERAAALEKQLRRVMDAADNTEEEGRLMSQWFNLVNKKNALLRRQMQLNILEREEDLSRRCELLAQELRLSLGVDEWRKTPGQKRRERLLLQELLSAVNERDRLVQEMDEQEKAIADDDAIERNLSQVEIQRKNNCILQ